MVTDSTSPSWLGSYGGGARPGEPFVIDQSQLCDAAGLAGSEDSSRLKPLLNVSYEGRRSRSWADMRALNRCQVPVSAWAIVSVSVFRHVQATSFCREVKLKGDMTSIDGEAGQRNTIRAYFGFRLLGFTHRSRFVAPFAARCSVEMLSKGSLQSI
ncbi:hypothetical protein KC356_g137 [Hortaea werneckii]|nr:hypothetical protein KC356_g137 [Hortaea werneckii]